jgi:hypothetical protein
MNNRTDLLLWTVAGTANSSIKDLLLPGSLGRATRTTRLVFQEVLNIIKYIVIKKITHITKWKQIIQKYITANLLKLIKVSSACLLQKDF